MLTLSLGLTLVIAPLPSLAIDESGEEAITALHSNWNGDNVIDLTEQLCNISARNAAYRVAGSAGADEAANMIAQTFQGYGLEVSEEGFQMPVWDLWGTPFLHYDHDGDANTSMVMTESFSVEGFSMPFQGIRELTTLPLPSAADRMSVGNEEIDDAAWGQVDISGKVLLIGREVRWDPSWEQSLKSKLEEQTPSAVIFHYSYPWMEYADQYSQASAGGRPLGAAGPFFWDLDIAVGSVNYSEGQVLRALASEGFTVNISVPAIRGSGLHRNIIADIPSSSGSDKIVLVGAHYDTVMCEGYIDNTASVATLLEAARAIQEAKASGEIELGCKLRFVAFAGEEMGLAGSIHYVHGHAEELSDHVAVLVADCIGSRSLRVTYAYSDGGMNINEVVDQASQALNVPYSIAQMDSSDHASFIYPSQVSANLRNYWGIDLGLQSEPGIQNGILFYSYPMTIYDDPDGPIKGMIHTSMDSISGVQDPSWVNEEDLKDQAEMFALSALIAAAPEEGATERDWYYAIPLVAAVALVAYSIFRLSGRTRKK